MGLLPGEHARRMLVRRMSSQPIKARMAATTKKRSSATQGEARKAFHSRQKAAVTGARGTLNTVNRVGTPVASTTSARTAMMHPSLFSRQKRRVKKRPRAYMTSMNRAAYRMDRGVETTPGDQLPW